MGSEMCIRDREEDRKNIAELVLKEMEVSHYYIDTQCQNYLNDGLKSMQMDIIQITNIL